MSADNVPVITTMLTAPEASALAEYERVIDAGMQTFYEVGNALLVIREQRLYRGTHGTFEAYVRDRWGMSDRHARRLVEASVVVDNIKMLTGPTGPVPTSERQARELVGLQPSDAVKVMSTAVAGTRGPVATSNDIRQARDMTYPTPPTRSQTLGGRQASPRRRPLVDDMRTLVVDANRLHRKLERLLDDDRLDRNAPSFVRHGADLRRLDDALMSLLIRLGVAE